MHQVAQRYSWHTPIPEGMGVCQRNTELIKLLCYKNPPTTIPLTTLNIFLLNQLVE